MCFHQSDINQWRSIGQQLRPGHAHVARRLVHWDNDSQQMTDGTCKMAALLAGRQCCYRWCMEEQVLAFWSVVKLSRLSVVWVMCYV